jgi:hypothetical protein
MRIPGIRVGQKNGLACHTFASPENEIAGIEPHMLQHPVNLLIIHSTVICRIHAGSENENQEHDQQDPGSSETIKAGKGNGKNHLSGLLTIKTVNAGQTHFRNRVL